MSQYSGHRWSPWRVHQVIREETHTARVREADGISRQLDAHIVAGEAAGGMSGPTQVQGMRKFHVCECHALDWEED